MSRLIEVKVTNKSQDRVGRGGYTFPPNSTRTMQVSEYQLAEIKPNVNLKVELIQASQNHVQDTITDGEGVSTGAETSETTEQAIEFECPYCEEYKGSTKQGLTTHVRMAHPDVYEEYKAGE